MWWTLFFCFLLASAHDIEPTPRPKRNLSTFTDFLSSIIFGTEAVAAPLTKTAKNATYQPFKIKGHDNVLLNRRAKKKLPVRVQHEELQVSPAMSLIGDYIGTNTQKKTVLGVARNLLKSGLLRNDNKVKEVLMSVPAQMPNNGYNHVSSVKTITEERFPVIVDPKMPHVSGTKTINLINRPIEIHPSEFRPIVVAEDLSIPFQSIYWYKQETDDADVTYESHNNRDVIVTRTNKVPVKPGYIAVRLADAISIGANPYLIESPQPISSPDMFYENLNDPLNVIPIDSYVMKNSPQIAQSYLAEQNQRYKESYQNYIDHLNSLYVNPPMYTDASEVPNFLKQSQLPFDVRDHLNDGDINKLNQYINAKLSVKQNKEDVFTSKPTDVNTDFVGDVNRDQKNTAGAGGINLNNAVSRYSYIQLGDMDDSNFTIVRIEDPNLNINEIEIKSDDDVPQNFVFVPPKDIPPPFRATTPSNIVYVPPPVYTTNDQNNSYDEHNKTNNESKYYPEAGPMSLREDISELPERTKINQPLYLSKNSVNVPTSNYPEKVQRQRNNLNKTGRKTNTGRPFTGGRSTRRTSRPFTGGR